MALVLLESGRSFFAWGWLDPKTGKAEAASSLQGSAPKWRGIASPASYWSKPSQSPPTFRRPHLLVGGASGTSSRGGCHGHLCREPLLPSSLLTAGPVRTQAAEDSESPLIGANTMHGHEGSCFIKEAGRGPDMPPESKQRAAQNCTLPGRLSSQIRCL